MRDVLPSIREWLAQGEPVILATVVNTWGSSPRREGAKMAFTPRGQIAGSVSGGCVEPAVYEAGLRALKQGRPELLHYGVSDEDAWEVGLACGGKIDVFVAALDPALLARQQAELDAERPFVTVTLVAGPSQELGGQMLVTLAEAHGSLAPGLDEEAVAQARQALGSGRSQTVAIESRGQVFQAFLDVVRPQPQLVMVGAVHIAIALASLAQAVGFATVVVDPRRSFASPERFPHAGRLLREWPQEALARLNIHPETAFAMLTHDPKIDDPALLVALRSPAFYVGALGSRTTQAKRRQRLLEQGLNPAELDRLHGPIGLDLGGKNPEEIALGILAEIVAVRNKITV